MFSIVAVIIMSLYDSRFRDWDDWSTKNTKKVHERYRYPEFDYTFATPFICLS